MNPTATMLIGLGAGASAMYLMDPQGGNRRRAVIRDKAKRGWRKLGDATDVTVRDLGNRAGGFAAEAQSRLAGQHPDDYVLAERVRAELGRVCSHPRSIEVGVRDGRVMLTGPILSHEADRVRAWVASIPGLRDLDDRLEVRDDAGRTPGLQGGVSRRARSAWMQTSWSPAVRLLAGATGSGLALYGVGRRDLIGLVTGASGVGLLARGVTNLEMRHLLGIGTRRPVVTVRKSLNIQASPARVYEFWRDIERFPRFMGNVRDVRDLGGGRSRWTVAGPLGAPVQWEAVITTRVPNEELAWETVPGSIVEHSGRVLFMPNATGGTRMDIHLSYAPPAGAVGHGIAWLFGADPKAEIDADLARLKTSLEKQQSENPAPAIPGTRAPDVAEGRMETS
jgi:uncharacterized membrane protein